LLHFDLSQQSPINNAQQFVSIGIAVITADAFAAGATPDPEGDFDQDWFYWTRRAAFFEQNGSQQLWPWDVDIRSMRVLRGGYKLVMITENPTNGSVLNLHTSMRLLWRKTL